MSGQTVYLITGANRGLGFELTKQILSKPNNHVIGVMRNLKEPRYYEAFKDLSLAEGSSYSYLATGFTTEDLTAKAARPGSRDETRITHLDVVIANAGFASAESFAPAMEQQREILERDFATNTLAPIQLFQASWPLLQKSQNPRFFVMSSYVGSITSLQEGMPPSYAYGMSKAAVNYFARSLHFEFPTLVSISLHPGWVKTDLGQAYADVVGAEEAPTTTVESVTGMLENVIYPATLETSGQFLNFKGEQTPW